MSVGVCNMHSFLWIQEYMLWCTFVCVFGIYISVLLSDYVFNAPNDVVVVVFLGLLLLLLLAIKSVLRCSFVYFWFCRTFWLSAMAAEPVRIRTVTETCKHTYVYICMCIYINMNVKFIMPALSGNCCCPLPLPAQFNRIESAPRMSHWKRSTTKQRLVVSSRVIENNLFYLLTILRFNLIKALRAGNGPLDWPPLAV